MQKGYYVPRPGESYFQMDRRHEAESKVHGLEERYGDDTTVRLFVKELLRNTRSPSKRPVYEAWLREHPEVEKPSLASRVLDRVRETTKEVEGMGDGSSDEHIFYLERMVEDITSMCYESTQEEKTTELKHLRGKA